MQIAKNNFTEGLVMDLSPEVTQNNCLTNALNATYITMNGNELQLQNDMGNAKFGAYLPAGYVPLGTTQLGGVIYTVIYNPYTNKTQVGSFPSPQIMFTPEEELGDESINLSYFSNNLQYKKIYNDITMQPGDKFMFYLSNTEELQNYIYDINKFDLPINETEAFNSFIKFAIGTVSQDGKLIQLQDLRNQYKLVKLIDNTYIPIEDDYNVYNSQISGNLALILTKVFCNNTNLQILTTNVDADNFKLQFTYTFASNDKFIPSSLLYNIGNGWETISFSSSDTGTLAPSNDRIIKWYRNNTLNTYKLSFNKQYKKSLFPSNLLNLRVLPIKLFNRNLQINLANEVSKSIDLTKLGTGAVLLTQYTYTLSEKEIVINFSYIAYLEATESVESVTVSVYESNNSVPLVSNTYTDIETSDYLFSINPKTSGIHLNSLYIVQFAIKIKEVGIEGTESTHTEYITRWLITENGLFTDDIQDYNETATVYYWATYRTDTLTLGQDKVTADYSPAYGISYGNNVNIQENHTFANSKLSTSIIFNSNVEHIKLNSKFTCDCSLQKDEASYDNITTEYSMSDMNLLVESTFDVSTNYTIKGTRTQKITSTKNIMSPLYVAYPNKYGYTGSILLDNITQGDLNQGIFKQNLINNPNISIITLTTKTSIAHLDVNGTVYNTIKGILIKKSNYQQYTDCCLITHDGLISGNSNTIHTIMQTLTSKLCVCKLGEDFTYYVLNNDYTVDQLDKLNIANLINITNATFDIKLGTTSLQTAMNAFVFKSTNNGTKPKNLVVNFVEDTTKTMDNSITWENLPKSNIDSYLSIDAETLFIKGTDNIVMLDNTSYYANTLYYTEDNGSVSRFKGQVVFEGGITCYANNFSIQQGDLLIDGNTSVLLKTENQDSSTTDTWICPCSFNSAIKQ